MFIKINIIMVNNERLNRFNNIINSWNNNVGIIDVYYAIIYWLEDFEDTIIAINDVNDIFTRMNNNELINDIVSDFIYGDCYVALRQEVINNN
uniref:Uncharacterized protein n=1 Tax=viral metagenome TaxID=1070528 RepID=A0A6C0DZS0_9ZZZZ